MNRYLIGTVALSAYRRRKSLWKVVLLSFLCVFLFGGIMIFQDVMNRFQRGNAIREGGDWFVASMAKCGLVKEHAYFDREGRLAVRTSAHHLSDAGYADVGEIGWADDVFLEQSHMKLLEGRMPETPEEIAVTKEGLAGMAVSFTVGQEICLYYDAKEADSDGNAIYRSKQVKVTGILPSYRNNWVDDIKFPDFFLTKEGLESLVLKDRETDYYFYSLGEGHLDVNGERLFKALGDLLAKEGRHDELVYNRASYDVTMWGSQKMYDMAMVLCAIMGSMSLIYLFSGCLHDRRGVYFRYLELGLTKGQLRGMVGLEWLVVFFPAAGAALFFSAVCVGTGAKWLSGRYGLSGLFYVSERSMAMILVFTFGVFALVLLWCFLGFRVRGLHEMTGQMPIKRLRRLRRKRDDRYGGLALFQRRRGRMYPGRAVARLLFTLVALCMVLYMSFLWEKRYRENGAVERKEDLLAHMEHEGGSAYSISLGILDGKWDNPYIMEDSSLSQREKEERRGEIPGLVSYSMSGANTLFNNMSRKQKEELCAIAGVRKVLGETKADDMKLEWDGCEHSTFRNNLYVYENQEFHDIPEGMEEEEFNRAYTLLPKDLSLYAYTIVGLERSKAIDRELSALDGEYDREAFWAGDQGILFALPPEDVLTSYPEEGTMEEDRTQQAELFFDEERDAYRFQAKAGVEYRYIFEEDSIRNGDNIRILDNQKKNLYTTKTLVSGDRNRYRRILESVSGFFPQDGYEDVFSWSGAGGYYLVGSWNMMKKIQEKVGKPLTYNRLHIWLEDGVDKEEAEKKVAKFMEKYHLEYQSNLEAKDIARGALGRQRMISLAVILLVLFCYFLIMQTMERKEMEQMRGRLQLLLQQGAWKRDILRMRGACHVKRHLCGLLALPLCCLWQGVGKWSSAYLLVRDEGESMEETGMDAGAFGRELLADWGEYLGDVWQWGILLFFLLGVVALTLLGEWRYLRKLKLYDHE